MLLEMDIYWSLACRFGN